MFVCNTACTFVLHLNTLYDNTMIEFVLQCIILQGNTTCFLYYNTLF